MDKIPEILKELEAKKDIQIIYAVEAGSRACKLESEDSDYDIRFIFKYNDVKKYLSLKKMENDFDGFTEDRVYDWQGWDIKKALSLIHSMNPSICEWLYSPIIYLNNSEINFQNLGKKALLDQNRILPLLYHYKSMARSNYKTHIQCKKDVKIKKYLYVIRPAGMLIWLLKKNEAKLVNFNIDFLVILEEIREYISEECYQQINRIIEKKKTIKEMDLEPRIKCIDNWIDTILNDEYQDDFKKIKEKETREDLLNNLDNVLFSILKI